MNQLSLIEQHYYMSFLNLQYNHFDLDNHKIFVELVQKLYYFLQNFEIYNYIH